MSHVVRVSDQQTVAIPGVIFAIGSSHAESGAIMATAVRILATVSCYAQIGPSPVADGVGGLILAGGIPEIFNWTPGNQLSVLEIGSSAGFVSVMPIDRAGFVARLPAVSDSSAITDSVIA